MTCFNPHLSLVVPVKCLGFCDSPFQPLKTFESAWINDRICPSNDTNVPWKKIMLVLAYGHRCQIR